MCKDPAHIGLLELTACKCEQSLCKANGLPCTEACRCMGDNERENPHKVDIDVNVSENDDEIQ